MDVASVLLLSVCFFLQWGRRAEAEAAARDLAELAKLSHDPFARVFSLGVEATLATVDGQFDRVLALCDEAIDLGRQDGTLGAAEMAAGVPAICVEGWRGSLGEPKPSARIAGYARLVPQWMHMHQLRHQGLYKEARDVLSTWLDQRGFYNPQRGQILMTGGLLDFAITVGDAEAAAVLAQKLDRLAGASAGAQGTSSFARLLGGAAAINGDREQAIAYYRQAIENSAKIGFRPELALSRLELALVLADSMAAGDRGTPAQHLAEHTELAEALAHLAFVIPECEAMGMQPALQTALALRAALAGKGARPVEYVVASTARSRYPSGLTRREVELLRLLAAGRTNREIAATLCISLNTVERHVNHILTKTACTNRVEAAGYAQRCGLLV